MSYSLEHLTFEGVANPRTTARQWAEVAGTTGSSVLTRPADASGPPDPFVTWLFERAGLSAQAYRAEPLRRRLPACFRTLRTRDAQESRRKLESRPELLPTALSAMLLGVTSFFRDPAVFSTLARLLPTTPPADRPLRIWSAGCSNGAEMYSVAMLAAEAGLLDQCELVGSDCRADALREAAIGRYDALAVADVPSGCRERFLVEAPRGVRVCPGLRERVRWVQHDVLAGALPGPWDVILWRNAAIYLSPAAAVQVWQGFYDELPPGGLLVVGRAERPPAALGLRRADHCIYRKGVSS